MSPQLIVAIISILREVLKLLGEKNSEYKSEMTKKERKIMLQKDIEAIRRAFREKDEKALNAVFNSDGSGQLRMSDQP